VARSDYSSPNGGSVDNLQKALQEQSKNGGNPEVRLANIVSEFLENPQNNWRELQVDCGENAYKYLKGIAEHFQPVDYNCDFMLHGARIVYDMDLQPDEMKGMFG
jgi:hypothetical protein